MAKKPSVDRCEHCGGIAVKISWSGLKTWEECRQKGSLMRDGKRTSSSDVRNFFPGRVTDRAVRYWLSEDPHNSPGRMPSMVREIIERELGEASETGERVDWRHKSDRDDVTAECVDAVAKIEPALNRYVLPYEWQVDFGFRTPVLMETPGGWLDRIILNGYMDILVHDPATDSWRIYDVKHTRNKDYWRGSFGQLAFYGYENWLRTGKIPVEVGFFQPLVEEQVKRFALSEAHINSLATRVQAMAFEAWSGEDAPRFDTKMCTFCETKHACVKFKAVEAPNGRMQVPLL